MTILGFDQPLHPSEAFQHHRCREALVLQAERWWHVACVVVKALKVSVFSQKDLQELSVMMCFLCWFFFQDVYAFKKSCQKKCVLLPRGFFPESSDLWIVLNISWCFWDLGSEEVFKQKTEQFLPRATPGCHTIKLLLFDALLCLHLPHPWMTAVFERNQGEAGKKGHKISFMLLPESFKVCCSFSFLTSYVICIIYSNSIEYNRIRAFPLQNYTL